MARGRGAQRGALARGAQGGTQNATRGVRGGRGSDHGARGAIRGAQGNVRGAQRDVRGARGGVHGIRGGTSGVAELSQSELSDPTTVTASRPQRANANIHPGKVINDAKQPRRTPDQIQKDKDEAAAAKLAAARNKEAHEASTLKRIASMEDQVHQEEADYTRYAMRPDLRAAKKVKVTDSECHFSH